MGDLLGGLQVVLEDGLLEVVGAHVLAGVHVDDRERLRVLDDERAARRQPHLPVECLVQLLVHVLVLEERQALGLAVVVGDAVGELGVEVRDVALDLLVESPVVDHHAAVVGVELLADHAHGELGLAVQQRGAAGLLLGGLDARPLVEQAGHVGGELLLRGVLSGGAQDHPVLGRLHPVEDPAEAAALGVGETLRDAVGLRVRDEHHEPARQGHFLGEACTLRADRVLRDLAQDHLLGVQDLLDARVTCGRVHVFLVVLDVAAVEDGVLRGADVDERGLHAGKHVLHAAEVDVAVDLADVVGGTADVVLDEAAPLQHGHLGDPVTDLHAHHVAADGTSVALAAAALLDDLGLDRLAASLRSIAAALLARAATVAATRTGPPAAPAPLALAVPGTVALRG